MKKTDLTDEQAQDILDQIKLDQYQQRQTILNQGLPTHDMELDMMLTPWLINQVKSNDVYAQNLYAAMCNVTWQEQEPWEILKNQSWSCSWRYAGGIIANMRGKGDYMDLYCTGIGAQDDDWVSEGVVTDQIRADLARIGWHPLTDDQT